MTKKIKVQYTKDVTVRVTPEVWDLCEETYAILLEEESLPHYSAVERSLEWYATKYKGGVGIKKAKEIMRTNSLFYHSQVEAGYEFVQSQTKKTVKRPKESKKGFNPEFIYNMAKFYVLKKIKDVPDGHWATYVELLKEKYDDKDKRDKRLGDRAQSNAYVMRALLLVLEAKGLLPKAAYA